MHGWLVIRKQAIGIVIGWRYIFEKVDGAGGDDSRRFFPIAACSFILSNDTVTMAVCSGGFVVPIRLHMRLRLHGRHCGGW